MAIARHVAFRPTINDLGIALAGAFLAFVVVLAIFAPIIVHDPMAQQLHLRLMPPGTPDHILGTDALGRDILSRLIHGARVSLLVALSAVVLGGTFGTLLGMLGGYYRGRLDAILTWLATVQLAFPIVLLAVALAAAIGGSIAGVIVILAATSWVNYARVVRSVTLSIREREYLQSAEALGATDRRILGLHIMPNILPAAIAVATLEAARMIILEAALTFLGVGVPAGTPSWGTMIAEGVLYMEIAWWITTLPGLLLSLVAVSINLIGDWVNDRAASTERS